MIGAWAVFSTALDRWAAAGRTARIWLRDDDAVEPTPALSRLLTYAQLLPVTLAVIPRDTGPALARTLAAHPSVSVALHGWAHANHAPPGVKSAELGPHRPAATVLGELASGRDRLAALYGAGFQPLLVPPWNRIDPALIPRLPGIGLSALSTFGPEAPDDAVRRVNTHVDLIDWRGNRGGRPALALATDLAARLDAMLDDPAQRSLGVLSHHLVHDSAAWAALDDIAAIVAGHPGAAWTPLAELAGTA
jgi:hypothetical protein